MSATAERTPAHVLIVDDSSAVRARLATLLRESPRVAEVHEAPDAQQARATLHARRGGADAIAIVVLDLHMPGQHGLELLPWLASATPRPVLVVLTNDASDAHRRECLALGADFFFDKSRHFDRILEVLDDFDAARRRYG